MSDVGVDTFDYARIPATGDEQREKVRQLVRHYRRDEADEAMLLDCIGIGTEAGNPPA